MSSSCRSSPLSGAVEITVKDADGGPLVADGVVGRATATLGPCGADPFEASVVSAPRRAAPTPPRVADNRPHLELTPETEPPAAR